MPQFKVVRKIPGTTISAALLLVGMYEFVRESEIAKMSFIKPQLIGKLVDVRISGYFIELPKEF